MIVKRKLRVLVLGATGMLGSTIFRSFSSDERFLTFGTIRDSRAARYFLQDQRDALISDVYLDSETGLVRAFAASKPDIVINCVGIIKQLPNSNDHLQSLAINSVLPHRLAKYCSMAGARLIHFSTDCVFSGKAGQYREEDIPDSDDLYGRTKYLGEASYEDAITLRTSIIGHELASARSLVDWFISQSGKIKGYRNAIFSGLPTNEIARILKEYVIPDSELKGVYHLSADPISKHDLLCLVAKIYGKDILIVPDDDVRIDRSLNSDRFRIASGYNPKPWSEMIEAMYNDYRTFSRS